MSSPVVFSSPKQMLILKAQFPEMFDKFVTLESHFRKKGAAFYFNYKPVYAKDLAKQKVLSVYGDKTHVS